VSSGTIGLLFTLGALGLKPGQKVVLPSFTFTATAQAVLYAGGIPLFADIGDDLNISVADLDRVLVENPETGAVIPVHMYGLPARAGEIEEVVHAASKRCGRRIPVIYDAAHAFGSSLEDRRIGTFGDAEVFSLSVTKVLVTVEGGLVSSRDPELLRRVKAMRNYGILSNYNAHFAGANGKMSEFHAIVGLHNLRRLDHLLSERQTRAQKFRRKIESATRFELTSWPQHVIHTFKDFTILLPEGAPDQAREKIISYLAREGIETRAYFHPPVHEQEFFRKFVNRPLPVTEKLSRRVITLPFYSTLEDEQMDYNVEKLKVAEKEFT
jgi:dTDP-4-amino-4,6-dideoxygalactose transaminase